MSERLNELNNYIANLSADERAKHEAKLENSTISDLIKQGDTVTMAIAVQNGADMTQQDNQGMTPLHMASKHGTELIADVLMNDANGAVWQRDSQDRLPLDVARENGHQEIGDKLEQVTYPELFKDNKDGLVKQETIQNYSTKQGELDHPDTAPSYAKDLKTREIMMRYRKNSHEKDELEH